MVITMAGEEQTQKTKRPKKRKAPMLSDHEQNSSAPTVSETDKKRKKLKPVKADSDPSLKEASSSENVEKNKKQKSNIARSRKQKRNKEKKKNRKSKEIESKKIFESMLKPGQNATTEIVKDSDDELPLEPTNQNKEEIEKKTVKKEKRKKSEKVVAEETKQPSAKDQALSYLQKWKNERQSWTFKKVRQVWLMKHIYDFEQIDEDNFDLLLNYLNGVKGGARSRLIQDAETLFAKSEEKPEGEDTVSDLEKSRARQVLQMLSE